VGQAQSDETIISLESIPTLRLFTNRPLEDKTMKRRGTVYCVLLVGLLLGPACHAISAPGEDSDENAAQILKGGGRLPDLIVSDIWIYPSQPVGGQSVTIYAQVQNIGTKAIKDTVFWNKLYVDGVVVATQTLANLAAGEYGPVFSAARTLAAGDHLLSAWADAGYHIDNEVSESNNGRYETVTCTSPYPDLIVTSISTIDPWGNSGSATSGQTIEVTVTVKNTGESSAGASSLRLQDIYGASTTDLATVSVPALASGASFTDTVGGLYLSHEGTHTLRGVADATNSVVEDNEDNNQYDVAFQVNLAEWTYAVYLDGDNNLELHAVDYFLDLASVGSSADLSIVVMLDRQVGYEGDDGRFGDTTGEAHRFFVLPGSEPYASQSYEDCDEPDMSDPATLVDFASDVFDRFSSTKTALVLFDHGSLHDGSFEDVTSNRTVMTLMELGYALESIKTLVGDEIDLLGIDTCLMGYFETFHELRRFAQNLVASAQLEYIPTWPDDDILSQLRANPTMTPQALASLIISEYEDYWAPPGTFPFQDQHTLVAVASLGLLNLGSALASVGEDLIDYLHEYGPEIDQARINCVEIQAGPAIDWGIDLYSFFYQLQLLISDVPYLLSDCQYVLSRIESAIVATTYGVGYGTDDMRALGVYFPQDRECITSDFFIQEYMALGAGGGEVGWADFLEAYHSRPSKVKALSADAGPAGIRLQWLPPTTDGGYAITDYLVYRGETPDSLSIIGSTGSGSTLYYIDNTVAPNTTYYYKVAAVNAFGIGSIGLPVMITYLPQS
jgi:hypothetical protein